MAKIGFYSTMNNRAEVLNNRADVLNINTNNFAFDKKVQISLESNVLDGQSVGRRNQHRLARAEAWVEHGKEY